MKPQTVDYGTFAAQPPRPLARRSTVRRRPVVVGLIAVLLVAAASVSVKATRIDVDATTGSSVTRTTYLFGVWRSPPKVETSAVEQRMRAIGATWRPKWQFLNRRNNSLVGLELGRVTGTLRRQTTSATSP